MNLNKVMLAGNLTRDPKLTYIPSGTAVCEFGLAINRKWTDKESGEKKEDVVFVDVTAWGRIAETITEYLSKGSGVFIEGRLQLDQWTDKESGSKRSKLKVVAESVQFVGGKRENGGEQKQEERRQPDKPTSRPADAPYVPSSTSEGDIPF